MHRRTFIAKTGLIAWSLPSLLASQSRREDPPHIIFIMADDMGYGDTTCYNPDSLIKTSESDTRTLATVLIWCYG